jgi:hypothetical protein
MKKTLVFVAAAVAVLIALPAVSLGKDKPKKAGEQVFDFEEDEVTVSFLKPDVGFVGVMEQEKAASLIKIREDFVDEIVRSAEDL